MFDPSKLNLDLDNLPKEKKEETPNKSEEKQETPTTILESFDNPILKESDTTINSEIKEDTLE